VDARDPLIEYRWLDVGVLDYDATTKLYLVQKLNRLGRVVDTDGKTVVNGGVLSDGVLLLASGFAEWGGHGGHSPELVGWSRV